MNITGSVSIGYGTKGSTYDGAFYQLTSKCNMQTNAVTNGSYRSGFNASRSWSGATSNNSSISSIYGNSSTVQPPSIKVRVKCRAK